MRYITHKKTKAWISEEDQFCIDRPSITVHEDEVEVEDTGLLDQYGNKLFRMPERNPIGFVLRTENERINSIN